MKICGGETLATFQTFVNPGHLLSPKITSLTGITDDMLADAPVISTVLPLLFDFLGSQDETVFVAHNAPFDLSFLTTAAALLGYVWPRYRVVDTVKAARHVLSKDDVINYRLATLASYFQTQVAPSHRALDDELATVDVLYGIIERMGSFGIFTTGQMMDVSLKRKRA